MLQAIGFGIGAGIVHCVALAAVLVLARTNAKNREDETLDLMRQRNDLDNQKVVTLMRIADALELSR